MYSLILIIHFLLCFSLIVLVLVQQGKGADMGAAFGGGGSNTFFGAAGATAFITKLTTGIAVAFMITSIGLIYFDPSGRAGGISIPLLQGKDRIQETLEKVKPPTAPEAKPVEPAQPAQTAPESNAAPVENSEKK